MSNASHSFPGVARGSERQHQPQSDTLFERAERLRALLRGLRLGLRCQYHDSTVYDVLLTSRSGACHGLP